MVRRLMLAAALVLLLPVGGAAETGRTNVTLPVFGGFALSFEAPPGWSYSFNVRGDQYGTYRNKKNGERPEVLNVYFLKLNVDYRERIYLHMMVYPSAISLENFADSLYMLGPYPNLEAEGFQEKNFDESFGRPSFSVTTYNNKTSPIEPFEKVSVTTIHDRIGISASLRTGNFESRAKTFDEIIGSIFVTPIADLNSDQVRHLYVSPDITFTPGNYGLEGGFSLAMPPGWQSEEVEVVEAGTGGAKAGRMIVEFFPSGASGEISFAVQMDGTPYDVRLSAAEFLAMRDPIVASMADDVQEVATEEGVGMPYGPDWDRPFCLSKGSTRRFHRSGRTEVKTYVGKDPLTGADVKLRIYTAGGFTLACNLIFRAPPEDFERLAPLFDEMVRTVKVSASGLITMR